MHGPAGRPSRTLVDHGHEDIDGQLLSERRRALADALDAAFRDAHLAATRPDTPKMAHIHG